VVWQLATAGARDVYSDEQQRKSKSDWRTCRVWGSQSPTSRLLVPNSIPGRSMWDLCWNKLALRQGFSRSTSDFHCRYHSTDCPRSFICLSMTLYSASNWQSHKITRLKEVWPVLHSSLENLCYSSTRCHSPLNSGISGVKRYNYWLCAHLVLSFLTIVI
jgi:hypothetical protein